MADPVIRRSVRQAVVFIVVLLLAGVGLVALLMHDACAASWGGAARQVDATANGPPTRVEAALARSAVRVAKTAYLAADAAAQIRVGRTRFWFVRDVDAPISAKRPYSWRAWWANATHAPCNRYGQQFACTYGAYSAAENTAYIARPHCAAGDSARRLLRSMLHELAHIDHSTHDHAHAVAVRRALDVALTSTRTRMLLSRLDAECGR